MPGQRDARAHQRDPDAVVAENGRDPPDLPVHERLAAGEADEADAEPLPLLGPLLDIGRVDRPAAAIEPDVAHRAAAVAAAVRPEEEVRELDGRFRVRVRADDRGHQRPCAPITVRSLSR